MYGGRKNCSRTTYMPRSISVRRKYLPALSREDSLPSSQRSLRARRKPWGGGPAGVAKRCVEVEKVAIVGETVRAARILVSGEEDGRTRASAVRERAEAIARFGSCCKLKGGYSKSCRCGNRNGECSDWL